MATASTHDSGSNAQQTNDAGPTILTATLPLTVLALITVVARVYVRCKVVRNFGWDDAFMGLAMALSIVAESIVVAGVHYGAGRHFNDISSEDFEMGLKMNFIDQPIFVAAVSLCKVAVGASLMRIAAQTFWSRIVLGVVALMTLYNLASIFTIVFQCTDIRVIWDPSVDSVCMSVGTLHGLSYTNVSMNILTDFAFAVLIPIPMLWKLNVNKRTRYSVIAILGLGIFACIAACIKTVYLLNYGTMTDTLWATHKITIWNVAELNIGIIAGSLPTLKPILTCFLGRSASDPSEYSKRGRETSSSTKPWATLSSGQAGRGESNDTESERGLNTDHTGASSIELVSCATVVVADGSIIPSKD